MITSVLNRTSEKPSPPSGEWKVVSPCKEGVVIDVCQYRYSDIDLAVSGAIEERSKLIKIQFADRLKVLKRAKETLAQHQDEIFQIAKKELGRSSDDLKFEWNQMESMMNALQADFMSERSIDESNPRGVTAVLGSSVWPTFYSVQFCFLNFLAGNPVILKPSERSTLTVLKLFEVLRAAIQELQSIQVLVGDREVGRRLACHESVATVIFQGSFEVGMRVRQDTLSQPSKEVLLFLGAKNPSIVFQDAPDTVYQTLLADAFQGAGQDCQSTALVFVENSFIDRFSERFHQLSKEFKIGNPEEAPFMGPLIDAAIMDRYFKFIGISEREGAQILMRGKPLKRPEGGHFVTPTLALFTEITPDQLRKSVSLQTEILSPHVSLIGFKNQEELLSLLAVLNHGRVASIWSSDEKKANELARGLDYGHIQINQSMRLRGLKSFQARRRSGNHAISGPGLIEQLRVKKQIN